MTELEFDQLLKRALREARAGETEDGGPMSPRQRERMEEMCRDPAGYYHRYGQEDSGEAGEPAEVLKIPAVPRRRRLLRYGAAAVVAALLGGSALAYSLTGGQFFRQMFLREAGEQSAVSTYMDANQLLEMGGGNVGTVQETEEIRLELLDAVATGNTAMIAVHVTAKELERFPQDGEKHRNYGFLEIQDALSESRDAFSRNLQYLCSDRDPALAENECILLLSYTSRAPIPDGSYDVELRDFGCLDTEEVLIPGTWTLSVALNGENPYSRTVEVGETYRFGQDTYLLSSVVVTPLSLTLDFSCDSDSMDCVKALWEQLDALSIQLRDGTVLDNGQFSQGRTSSGADGHWDMTALVDFGLPLPAEAIQSLDIGGQTVALPLD